MVAKLASGAPPTRSPANVPPRAMGSSSSQPSLPTTVQRNRLTPRSAEACRRTGIEPSELLPLPRTAFKEAGQPPEAEQIKWDRYENLRIEAYQAVRNERDRIIAEQGDKPFVGDATVVAVQPPRTPPSPTAALVSDSALAEDTRAFEKLKKKQQAEIEQMLMFEIRTTQMTAEKEAKLKLAKEAEEREMREQTERKRAAAEQRRQLEKERRDAEEEADRDARRRARSELEREAKRIAEEEEAERQRLVAHDRKERERYAKQQARIERQQAELDRQQKEAYAKQEEDAKRERERLDKLERRQREEMEELQASRDRVQKRIAMVMQMKEERTDQMRSNYLKKLEYEEQRREKWQAAQEEARQAKRKAALEKAAHVHEVQHMMELTVETRKNEIIGKEREHLELKAKADEARQEAAMKDAAEKEMRLYTRQIRQMRHQRCYEYKRSVLAAKIEMERVRTEDLENSRRAMQRKHKETSAKNVLVKQEMSEKMERMRSSSSLEVDDTMRGYVHNPELRELLDRCDERSGGSAKVNMDTMRLTLKEMQSEGKLFMGSRGSHGGEGLGRPRSAGALK
jgi:myosin heavy subunit